MTSRLTGTSWHFCFTFLDIHHYFGSTYFSFHEVSSFLISYISFLHLSHHSLNIPDSFSTSILSRYYSFAIDSLSHFLNVIFVIGKFEITIFHFRYSFGVAFALISAFRCFNFALCVLSTPLIQTFSFIS